MTFIDSVLEKKPLKSLFKENSLELSSLCSRLVDRVHPQMMEIIPTLMGVNFFHLQISMTRNIGVLSRYHGEHGRPAVIISRRLLYNIFTYMSCAEGKPTEHE